MKWTDRDSVQFLLSEGGRGGGGGGAGGGAGDRSALHHRPDWEENWDKGGWGETGGRQGDWTGPTQITACTLLNLTKLCVQYLIYSNLERFTTVFYSAADAN